MSEPREDERRGLLFWLTAAVGWVVIAGAVRGLIVHRVDTRPGELARFVVGGVIVHDAIVAPLALAGGWALARLLRGRVRTAVQALLVMTLPLAAFSYPAVRGFGRRFANPTSLPHDYGRNVVVVVTAIAITVAIAVAITVTGVVAARGRRATGRR